MALNLTSNLRIKKGLIWEIIHPSPIRINPSPVFILLNSMWMFELDLLRARNKETGDTMFNIYLKNLCGSPPLQSFEVTTFLEFAEHKIHMNSSTLTISSEEGLVFSYSYNRLVEKIPNFEIAGDLFVLFVFSSSTDLGFNVQKYKCE